MRIKVDVDVTDVAVNLSRYTGPVWRMGVLEPAILKAGLFVQAWAQRLCPVDTGTLRSNALTLMNNTEYLTRAEIRFANVWYALIVHENLHGNVPRGSAPGSKSPPGPGGPFFLKKALEMNIHEIQQIIATEMRRLQR